MRNRKNITVTFSPEELKQLDVLASSSCCKRAQYIRRTALQKPISLSYRNKSFDDFIDECIRLRVDMKEILALPLDQLTQQQLVNIYEAINLAIYKLYDLCKPN